MIERPYPAFYPTKSSTSRGPLKRADLPGKWGGVL